MMKSIILKRIPRPIVVYLFIGCLVASFNFFDDLNDWICVYSVEGSTWVEGFSSTFFRPSPQQNCKRVSLTKENFISYPIQIALWPMVLIKPFLDGD